VSCDFSTNICGLILSFGSNRIKRSSLTGPLVSKFFCGSISESESSNICTCGSSSEIITSCPSSTSPIIHTCSNSCCCCCGSCGCCICSCSICGISVISRKYSMSVCFNNTNFLEGTVNISI
jgi:hypothetical protein